MGAIASTCRINSVVPNIGGKIISVVTPATADTGDTIAITLSAYGATAIRGIWGCTETTDGSVVITEAPTTAVSSGVLTITTGGSGNTDHRRCYLVVLE
jgi:hypothetical protein